MVSFRDPVTKLPKPSYDLWEERFGVHAFTVASVIAGLRAAENFAKTFRDDSLAEKYGEAAEEVREGLNKYLYHNGLKRYARTGFRNEHGYELDEIIDVSLSGLAILGVVAPDDPKMVETMEQVKNQLWLKTAVEGCARYMNDKYQLPDDAPKDIPGNPWFFSTLWLGEYYIDIAKSKEDLQKAVPYLEWCSKNALPSGVLAEQVHPVDGTPLSVSPLTWSHSAFVWTVLKYSDKFNELNL